MRQTLTQTDWSDMSRRLLTIAIVAPFIIFSVVYGTPFFDVVVILAGTLALFEFHRMTNNGSRGFTLTFIGYSVLVTTIAYQPGVFGWGMLVIAIAATATWILHPAQNRMTTFEIPLALMGALYIGIPIALIVALRATGEGFLWINVLMWTTWFTDSWALLGGRALGRTKLAPQISPGKTVEGALVGITFGMVAGGTILLLTGKPIIAAIGLSLLIALATVAGDLFESFLKRYFNVKDASGLLPGHGGFMDRLDSFLVSAPLYYLVLVIFSLI